MANLIRSALVCCRLFNILVSWEPLCCCGLGSGSLGSLILTTDSEVRCFKEFDFCWRQFFISSLAIHLSKLVLFLRWTGLATRPDREMGRADIVRSKVIEGCVDDFGLCIFLFELINLSGVFRDLSSRISDCCAIGLNLGFDFSGFILNCMELLTSLRLLESHLIIRGFIL